MVDWKKIFENWDSLSEEMKKKIFVSMDGKARTKTEEFKKWLLQDPYRWKVYDKFPVTKRFILESPFPRAPPLAEEFKESLKNRIEVVAIVSKAKPGAYNVMWYLKTDRERPAIFGSDKTIPEIEKILSQHEELYDATELQQFTGEDWYEELPDQLKRDGVVVWTDSNIEWEPEAQQDRLIYHKQYSNIDLMDLKVEDLRNIARIKNLKTDGNKNDLINRILGREMPPPERLPEKPVYRKEPTRQPPPIRPQGLTQSDVNRLQDEYQTALFDGLGRVPTNSMAKFRVEVRKVADKTYTEALDHVKRVANEIVDTFTALKAAKIKPPTPGRPTRRIITGVRPDEAPREPTFMVERVPPTVPPKEPLDGPEEAPWPRHPNRREEIELWKAFQYRLQEVGMIANNYRKQFEDYIYNNNHKNWSHLLERFEFFTRSIIEGLALPPMWQWRGEPIPYGLREHLSPQPIQRIIDLIVWATSNTVSNKRMFGQKPTVDDVIEELEGRGISVSYEDVKDALTKAWKEKGEVPKYKLWFTLITFEDLEELLATHVLESEPD